MSGTYYPAESWLELKPEVIDEVVDRVNCMLPHPLTEDQQEALTEALASMSYDKDDFIEEEGDYYDDNQYL